MSDNKNVVLSLAKLKSLEELSCFAATLIRLFVVAPVAPPLNIGLIGELGAGKTTLVRAVIAAMGGDISCVSSPTYNLCNIYNLPTGIRIEHWDLYRLNELPEELIYDAPEDTIRLIEWSNKFPELEINIKVFLEFIEDNQEEGRNIRVVGC